MTGTVSSSYLGDGTNLEGIGGFRGPVSVSADGERGSPCSRVCVVTDEVPVRPVGLVRRVRTDRVRINRRSTEYTVERRSRKTGSPTQSLE